MFCIIFLCLLSTPHISAIGQSHYECGEHGRFEYCIDGIPGCIVGCHCHPGYYFDTDSKICEPNAKLVHEYRRIYGASVPTRVPDIFNPSEFELEGASNTTANPSDAKVDNIAKDSDDLGDWLYNQFFKTIESQVINNTNDVKASDKPPTRRSGTSDGPLSTLLKPKRRMGKKKKALVKKDKKKKNDLRRKLLRISEDDSLFDSGSSSSEDSSDSSSDSDTSGSTGESAEHDDKEHGHRKILMFNKKPKPPLPSFIFLPHMETPFFPPIGIPPPPMPMYPMVPIPPMPVFVFPTTTPSGDTSITTTPVEQTSGTPSTHPPDATTATTDTENETKTTTETTTEASATTSGLDPPALRSGKHQSSHRKKILKQLQQRMNLNRKLHGLKKKKPYLQPEIMDEPPDYEVPFMDESNFLMDQQHSPPPQIKDFPPASDVDFKYLTQLIHKMNKSENSEKIPPISGSPPFRRTFANQLYSPPTQLQSPYKINTNNQRFLESPDESYYSNLGLEIASLIRKMDANGDKRLNIELERNVTPPQPVINENSYAPRSYWERSVRSLLNRFQPENNYPLKKNEENLFNLEAKVETVASTTRSLSLNELENVIFLIDKTKKQLQGKTNQDISTTTPKLLFNGNDDSLNINLLPHQYERPKTKYDYMRGPIANILSELVRNYTSDVGPNRRGNDLPYNINGVLVNNFMKIPANFRNISSFSNPNMLHDFKNIPDADLRSINSKREDFNNVNQNLRDIVPINIQLPNLRRIGNMPDLRNIKIETPENKNVPYPHWNITKSYKNDNIANLQRIVGAKLNEVRNSRNQLPRIPWLPPNFANMLENRETHRDSHIHPPPPLNIKFQVTPRRHAYQTPPRYYIGNNNQLHQRTFIKPAPSYFHHELQHFDFFDK